MAVMRLTELEELSNKSGDIIDKTEELSDHAGETVAGETEELGDQEDDTEDTEDIVVKTEMLSNQRDEYKQLNDHIETNSDRPRY